MKYSKNGLEKGLSEIKSCSVRSLMRSPENAQFARNGIQAVYLCIFMRYAGLTSYRTKNFLLKKITYNRNDSFISIKTQIRKACGQVYNCAERAYLR